jgi:hypothetical protein
MHARRRLENKMTFPETNASLRTEVSFDDLTDADHHKGPTPLTGLGIGLVSQVVLDYMHLVCLGVVKRLLLLWMKGPLQARVGHGIIEEISIRLVHFKQFIPSEFPRRPRSLLDVYEIRLKTMNPMDILTHDVCNLLIWF